MPQWEAGDNVSSNWGGSTDAVLSTSENPIAAAELATWINTADEPALAFATEQFLFPAYTPVLENPAFLDQESEFYGGEQVNKLFSEISETVSTDFGWLPFMDYVYSSYSETVGQAIADRSDLQAGVDGLAGGPHRLRRGPGLHRRVTAGGRTGGATTPPVRPPLTPDRRRTAMSSSTTTAPPGAVSSRGGATRPATGSPCGGPR